MNMKEKIGVKKIINFSSKMKNEKEELENVKFKLFFEGIQLV